MNSDISIVVTFDNSSSGDIAGPDASNVTFSYNTSDTATFTAVAAGVCTSATITQDGATDTNVSMTCTFPITTIADNTAISLNVTLNNLTNQITGIVNNLTIDDTLPTCTSGDNLVKSTNINLGQTNTVTCACTDNIQSPVDTNKAVSDPSNPVQNLTFTGDQRILSGSDVDVLGTYTLACNAEDYAGNGLTNSKTFTVNRNSGSSSVVGIGVLSQMQDNRTTAFFIAGGVLIFFLILVGGFFFFRKR